MWACRRCADYSPAPQHPKRHSDTMQIHITRTLIYLWCSSIHLSLLFPNEMRAPQCPQELPMGESTHLLQITDREAHLQLRSDLMMPSSGCTATLLSLFVHCKIDCAIVKNVDILDPAMPHLLRGYRADTYLCTPQSQQPVLSTGVFAQVSQHCVHSIQQRLQGSALIYYFGGGRKGKREQDCSTKLRQLLK